MGTGSGTSRSYYPRSVFTISANFRFATTAKSSTTTKFCSLNIFCMVETFYNIRALVEEILKKCVVQIGGRYKTGSGSFSAKKIS